MRVEDLNALVKDIVRKATVLKDKHTSEKNAPVNYACIFSHGSKEYDELLEATRKIGKVIKETPTGQLFHIKQIKTVSGDLKLLKIRVPDTTRPERGDADFTIEDFPTFEKKYLGKKGFSRMDKPDFYMIELMDVDFDVRAYFSNPPLTIQLGIR